MPPFVARLLTLPGMRHLAARRINKFLQHFADLIPADLGPALEAVLVHDLIGNVDTDGDGEPDAFRIAITNCWFYQHLVGVELRVDGKKIAPDKLLIDNGFEQFDATTIKRIRYEPGLPFTLTVPGRPLPDGLHYVDIELHGEVAPLYALSVPIAMKDGVGIIAVLTDPPDPALHVSLPAEAKATVHFVPHVHFDLEWLRDQDTFARLAVENLLEAIDILEQDKQATFVIDQAPQLDALARLAPEAMPRLKALVDQGRMELLMGFYAEPDVNMVHGESLVRQAIYWQRYCRRHFGKISTIGWLPDSFGMSATLPQILRKAGCSGFAFSRGVADRTSPGTFMWEGLDGTRIKTQWMHELYFPGYPLPHDERRAEYKLARVYQKLADKAPTNQLFCPAGIDHGRPQRHVGQVLMQFNAKHPNVHFERSLPSRFFAALPDRGLPVIKGEFNPDNAGVYGARPQIKHLHRRAEVTIADLERICLMAGGDTPHELLDDLWTQLFHAQFHDSLPGCHPDDVSAQIEYRLRRIIDLAERAIADQLDALASQVTAPTDAIRPIIVVNTLPFQREETFSLELTAVDSRLPLLTDGKKIIPVQVLRTDQYADGRLKRATVLVSVQAPPLGYRVLWIVADVGQHKDASPRAVVSVHDNTLRNGWLDVTLDPETGTVARIVDRQREFLFETPNAGQLTISVDRGSLYMTARSKVSRPKRFKPHQIDLLENGPIRASIRFTGKVGGNDASLTYILNRGSKRVDVKASIDLRQAQRSLDVRIPLLPDTQAVVHEIPYGEIARDETEYPALTYVDITGEGRGLALLNAGTPGHRLEKGELTMCLLRSVDKIHFHDAGPGAQSLGRQTFNYALFPHQGDSRQARVYRRGAAFNAPLRVRVAQAPSDVSNRKPIAATLLTLTPDSIEVGALYRDHDGAIVLRLIERGGKDTAAQITPRWPFNEVHLTDLLGRSVRLIKTGKRGRKKGVFTLAFRAFEIKTLRFT